MKTLSDKLTKRFELGKLYISEEDVKEFIRMLKYEIGHTDIIDRLTGEKLKEGPFI